ncbi:MAG TPA: asparagine synthase-related protein, partial [Gemmatimonadaceae bacterium]|nr:asparagine synthase-related protein [Gemmatimonadaceae bacterium]
MAATPFVLSIVSRESASTGAVLARQRAAIARRARESGASVHDFRFGPAVALLCGGDPADAPRIAVRGSVIAVGDVRLDNRQEIARSAEIALDGLSDLDIALHALWRGGARAVPMLEGDFAVVVFDVSTRRGVAARDAFGVRALYWSQCPGITSFASHAALLADGEAYDIQYLTEFAAGVTPSSDRSAFAGVSAVPPAGSASIEGERLVHRVYWSPLGREPREDVAPETAIEEFRSLLVDAVRLRLTGGPDVWSELSGGLDSSSIVSIAQTLAKEGVLPAGVSGTVTYADSVGAGADEREYSDAVIDAYGVRNEVFVDSLLWEDDGSGPPLTDAPDGRLLLHARDRRVLATVRGAGGRVLLSGLGSDHYLLGNMFFFADWLAAGRVREALSEMVRWAALGRVSFWKLAYLNAALPLVPPSVRRRLVPEARVPEWIPRTLVEEFGLADRRVVLRSYSGPVGGKYAHENAAATASIPSVLDRGLLNDALDLRYPFLHRPLVEFALRLPHALCAQPCRRKWILREAMRGVLPEPVRTRQWKGTFDGRSAWSLMHDRERIEKVLRDPIAAQLGCIEADALRSAVATESEGSRRKSDGRAGVLQSLTLETWLL